MKRKAVTGIFLAAVLLFSGCLQLDSSSQAPPQTEGPGGVQEEAAPDVPTPDDPTPDGPAQSQKLKDDIAAGYLILVNKENGLSRDYKPADLKDIKYFATDRSAEGRFMRAAAVDAFHSLVEEAAEQGMELVMTTAYRSYGFQATLYNNYVASDGQAAADRYSARPGFSEHQTGLAVDISTAKVGYKLTLEFAETAEGKWLAENAHRFGFIERYPKDKEEITGYRFEPWHLRYVGDGAAEYIRTNDITFEEYIQFLENETEEQNGGIFQ